MCFCGWILVHGDFLVLIFLALPAALIAMVLALPTLGFEGNKGWIAGAIIIFVANLGIAFSDDFESAGNSMVPAMTSMRDYFVEPTHYVAATSATVEWWPKDSQGRTSETLPNGVCVKVEELFAGDEISSKYSRVVVLGLDGTRYIRRSELERLMSRHRCDDGNRVVGA